MGSNLMRNHESSGRRRIGWTIVVSSVVGLTFVAMGVVAVAGLSSGREPGTFVYVLLLGAAWEFLAKGAASRSRRCRPSEGYDSNREGHRVGQIPVDHAAPVRRDSH